MGWPVLCLLEPGLGTLQRHQTRQEDEILGRPEMPQTQELPGHQGKYQQGAA